MNVLSNGFVYDDYELIEKNPWITNPRYLPNIFSESMWSFNPLPHVTHFYRPLALVIFMITYYLFALAPWGFHLVNLLFHAANTMLVFAVASRLLAVLAKDPPPAPHTWRQQLSWPPFVAALLFAVHPIQTEAVAWVSAMPELSFTFFCLLSFWLFPLSSQVRAGQFALSVVAFAFAVACKETAVTLVLLLAAYDYLARGTSVPLSDRLRRHLPYYCVVAVYLAARWNALGTAIPIQHDAATLGNILTTAVASFTRYVYLLILPIDLTVAYQPVRVTSLLSLYGATCLLVTSAYCACVAATHRRHPLVTMCLLLVIVPLLPVLYGESLAALTFSERYLYLSTFGFTLLLGIGVHSAGAKVKHRARAGLAVLAVLGSAYGLLTVARTREWKNDHTLFGAAVAHAPDNEHVRGNLGNALLSAGRTDEAIEHFRAITEKINPQSQLAHYNLGRALATTQQTPEAIEAFERAVALNPNDQDAHSLLTANYLKAGRVDEAIARFQQTRQPASGPIEAALALAQLLEREGNPEAAITLYERAVAIDPENEHALIPLGQAYARAGQLDRGIQHLEAIAKAHPSSAQCRNVLGAAYLQNGMPDEAIAQFRAAVEIDPSRDAYRKNLDTATNLKRSAQGAAATPSSRSHP